MQSVRFRDQAGSMDSWPSVLVYFWFSYNTVNTIFLSSVNQLSRSHFILVRQISHVKLSRDILGHKGIGGGVRKNNANRFLLRINV